MPKPAGTPGKPSDTPGKPNGFAGGNSNDVIWLGLGQFAGVENWVLVEGDFDDGSADTATTDGEGNDNIRGTDNDNIIQEGEGNDVLFGFGGEDELYGGDGNDALKGGDGNDELSGEAGNDELAGGQGDDDLDGGDGSDTADYSDDPAVNNDGEGVIVNLSGAAVFDKSNVEVVGAHEALDGWGGTDTLTDIENAGGSAFNDHLQGQGGASNTLIGNDGADFLRGDPFTTGAGTANADDLLFAGSETQADANGVFGEGTDANVVGHSSIVEAKFNNDGDPSGFWQDFGEQLMSDANLLEGREGDDALVASDQADAFLWQFQLGTVGPGELDIGALGRDTVHQFTLGEDHIIVMNQADGPGSPPGDDASRADLYVKSGSALDKDGTSENGSWEGLGAGDSGQWTLTKDVTDNTATLAYDEDADTATTDDQLEIDFVGLQGVTAGTTVDDFFGG